MEVATMPLLPWEKKRKLAEECFDHLRRLVEVGCENSDQCCHYCATELFREAPHRPGCPYVVAKEFVEGQQRALRAAVATSRPG